MSDMSTFDNAELLQQALSARRNAYAPYSHFQVGAVLVTAEGQCFSGCNIENASYTPTVCAERTAVFKAVSEGHTSFEMIAVAGGKGGKITGAFPPCGVCRQVLAEFCAPDFPVLLVTGDDSFEKLTLDGLLPRAFYPSYIEL